MVAAATRASLAAAARMALTLRMLGAEDGRIASVFDRPVALRALAGGALGAGAAALALLAAPLSEAQAALGLSAAPDPAAGAALWGALAAPPIAAAIAYATARLSALAILRRAR